MPIYEAGSEKCILCNKKLDPDKYKVDWFFTGKVDYEAAYGLWKYSDYFCHYDCYNNWEYKEIFEEEVKREKERQEELNKRVEGANESERREIMEEEVRQWNEKVRRNKYNFERFDEAEFSNDVPEYDFYSKRGERSEKIEVLTRQDILDLLSELSEE